MIPMVVDVDSVNCLTSRTTCYTVTDGDTSLQGLYTVCFAMSVKKRCRKVYNATNPPPPPPTIIIILIIIVIKIVVITIILL